MLSALITSILYVVIRQMFHMHNTSIRLRHENDTLFNAHCEPNLTALRNLLSYTPSLFQLVKA